MGVDHQLLDVLKTIRLVVFDFDGVFTDNTVFVTQDGVESVCCWRSDGIGLSRLRSVGVEMMILSTEMNPVVSVRAMKLKVACRQGVEDKKAGVLGICSELGIEPCDTVFVGNDINDIPAFKVVGLPVGVADAYPEIHPHISYRTSKPGGHGAVREVCDLIFHARQGSLDSEGVYGA